MENYALGQINLNVLTLSYDKKGGGMNRELQELFKVRDNVVYSVTPETAIKDAVNKMNKHHIGALMVQKNSGEVEGILTERDVMKKLASTDDLVGHILVKEIMTPRKELIVITGNEKIGDIMEIMTQKGVRHLPIIDEDVLHGIIAMRDILKMLLIKSNQNNEDLKNYVEGKYPA